MRKSGITLMRGSATRQCKRARTPAARGACCSSPRTPATKCPPRRRTGTRGRSLPGTAAAPGIYLPPRTCARPAGRPRTCSAMLEQLGPGRSGTAARRHRARRTGRRACRRGASEARGPPTPARAVPRRSRCPRGPRLRARGHGTSRRHARALSPAHARTRSTGGLACSSAHHLRRGGQEASGPRRRTAPPPPRAPPGCSPAPPRQPVVARSRGRCGGAPTALGSARACSWPVGCPRGAVSTWRPHPSEGNTRAAVSACAPLARLAWSRRWERSGAERVMGRWGDGAEMAK